MVQHVESTVYFGYVLLCKYICPWLCWMIINSNIWLQGRGCKIVVEVIDCHEAQKAKYFRNFRFQVHFEARFTMRCLIIFLKQVKLIYTGVITENLMKYLC